MIARMMYGWKLLVLAALPIALFSYAMFQGGFVSWFLFYAFLPFVLYAILFAFYPLKKITVKRQLSQSQFKAGEQLEAVIILKRKFPFPLMFVVVEDCLPNSLLKSDKMTRAKRVLFLWFQKEVRVTYTIKSIPRGKHHLKAVRLRSGDLLGLLEKEVYIPLETSLLVFPSYQDINYIGKSGSFDDQVGTISDIQQQHSVLVSGIREYQPGDRFSWVDWKTSARRNQLITKEFEQMKGHDLLIWLDQSPSIVFEDMVMFTASIVRSALKNGISTGLVSIGKDRHVFPVCYGDDHLKKLFYHLALVDCNAVEPFDQQLERELKLSSNMRDTVKYIVTGSITPELSQVLEQTLRSKAIKLFLIKGKNDSFLKDEQLLIQHLKVRGIEVNVFAENHFSQAFAKAR
ncbi:DUF58 domain-containing protein [Bacillus sp. WMMC1349]|nr:DUF58 domain-containing protein [Bacillus sp. WMMC1349]